MAQLNVEKLNFYFGFTQILKEIDFTLERGKIISIVGPSGGGKTTLLKLCANLLDVVEGEVENSFNSSAFAFQDPRLLPWKSALENIMMPLHVKMQRVDTLHSVEMSYNPSSILPDARMNALMPKLFREANPEERALFGVLWQERVRNILENCDKVLLLK